MDGSRKGFRVTGFCTDGGVISCDAFDSQTLPGGWVSVLPDRLVSPSTRRYKTIRAFLTRS